MGIVMVKCSRTGRAISTGMEMDPVLFSRSPVFFGRTFCPHCAVEHEWFARDAWVDEGVGAPQELVSHGGRRPASKLACLEECHT